MPFIDPDFLWEEKTPIQILLITCADNSNVVKTAIELAKIFHDKGNSVLWVDGNLGENNLKNIYENPTLEKVIQGLVPLTEAIQQIDSISVLSGHSKHFLAEQPEVVQQQFISDLKKVYSNFDKIILSVNGKNPALQKKWLNGTENIYALFNAQNLLLNRTASWLKENKEKVKGLIGIGENDQDVLLAYMRLKEMLGDIPKLILDIKKIAP